MSITNKRTGAVSHVGQVVSSNGRDGGSTFGVGYYAVVAVGGGYERVSTGWYYDGDGETTADAEVDAPAAVLAQYAADLALVEELRAEVSEVAEAAHQARIVEKGKRVVVVRGRKVAKGTTGVCIWVGAGTFGDRVGIKDDAGTVHWTALTNVEVAQAAPAF